VARSAIHPGQQLATMLEVLDMSASALGRQLRMPANRVIEILEVQRAITSDTALRLGHFFNTSPKFWLNLQAIYELHIAERRSGEGIKLLPTLPRSEKKYRATDQVRRI
jgi:antitoxin HigA-1